MTLGATQCGGKWHSFPSFMGMGMEWHFMGNTNQQQSKWAKLNGLQSRLSSKVSPGTNSLRHFYKGLAAAAMKAKERLTAVDKVVGWFCKEEKIPSSSQPIDSMQLHQQHKHWRDEAKVGCPAPSMCKHVSSSHRWDIPNKEVPSAFVYVYANSTGV